MTDHEQSRLEKRARDTIVRIHAIESAMRLNIRRRRKNEEKEEERTSTSDAGVLAEEAVIGMDGKKIEMDAGYGGPMLSKFKKGEQDETKKKYVKEEWIKKRIDCQSQCQG